MESAMHRAFMIFILAVALSGTNLPQPMVTAAANPNVPFDVVFGITVTPSTVVVKVGEKANLNVTITNPEKTGGQVCFSLAGFPESGFRTSFNPECAITQQAGIATVLTVEATPAAAPQSFTAFVMAKIGSQIAQTSLNVTVEPAMPAWIPWLGLILFFAILGIAVAWKPRLPFKKITSRKGKRAKLLTSYSTDAGISNGFNFLDIM